MRKFHWKTASLLFAGLMVGWAVSNGYAQLPVRAAAVAALPKTLAEATELEEEDVAKVLNALGPAMQQQLASGRQVALPGLGVFRVVRIPPHRDLEGGRPVLVPGRNYVEFLPDSTLNKASNHPAARPAVTVKPFQYNPLPNQAPTRTVPRVRTPSTRVR